MIEAVRPLEETDPVLAEHFQLIVAGSHPTIERIHVSDDVYVKLKKAPPIQVQSKVGRNDPCPCGSSRKYKKCCGRS